MLLKDMNEPLLQAHMGRQIALLKTFETEDTIGSMLIVFGDDGISQYAATIDPASAPTALRELADRIEKNQQVKRGVM